MNQVLLFAIFLIVSECGGLPLFIGAFNVRVFGKRKMNKPKVVEVLVKIIQRYDIVMIQEIRESSGESFPNLVQMVNDTTAPPYDYVISPRSGRTRSKEQYGFIYRRDRVTVLNVHQHPDAGDLFEREPYVVQFNRTTSEGQQRNFSYISIHTKPSDAIAELNALYNVSRHVENMFGEDILIGGDFNGDCRYVCKRCWKRVKLREDPAFRWLISDTADTTVKEKTDCAYDRLIVTGTEMTTNAQNGSVFYFDEVYNLTSKLTKAVSDHYPVEFYLD